MRKTQREIDGERDLSEISGFEAPHTGGQRWGRVCRAIKELMALMKEITSVFKHFHRRL